MFKFFALVTATLLIGTLPALAADGSCKSDPTDPFAPDSRAPQGPHAGECLDTSSVRGLRPVEPDYLAKNFGVQPRAGTRLVANFRHNQQFWIAEIPLNGIRQMIMQRESSFGNIPFHHQNRYINDPDQPIRLFPQTPAQMKSYKGPLLVTDYVVSAIGLRPASLAGQPFSIMEAFKGSYTQGVGMVSMQDAWVYDAKELGHELAQKRLITSRADRTLSLVTFIDRSIKIGETLPYSLSSETCVTELFFGYAKIARVKHPFKSGEFAPEGETYSMPHNTLHTLKRWGLIADDTPKIFESAPPPAFDPIWDSIVDEGVPPFSVEWETKILPTPLSE
jgi:hypothetical protein